MAGTRGLRGLAALGADAEVVATTGPEVAEGQAPAAEDVGARIRAARLEAGMTGAELGVAMGGLRKDQVSKIESGRRRVDVAELAGAAAALNTSMRALLGRPEPALRPTMALAARLGGGAGPASMGALRRHARRLLEFDDLLSRVAHLPAAQPSSAGARVLEVAGDRTRFPTKPRSKAAAIRQGREMAELVRTELALGTDALGDLATLMEQHFAVDVSLSRFGTDCDGLCVHGNRTEEPAAGTAVEAPTGGVGGPSASQVALILASSDYPAGHVRFTLAHELGHHLFADPRPVLAEGEHQMFSAALVERRANAFAGYVLMPVQGVRATVEWAGGARGAVSTRVLAALMEHFGVSRKALLWQLELLDLLGYEEGRQLENSVTVRDMLQRHRDVAPTGAANVELGITRAPQRLIRAARAAAQEQVLGLSVIAALLGRPDDEELWDEVMGQA